MKKFFLANFAFLLLLGAFSCNAQDSKKAATVQTAAAEKIEVYYFHFTRRCHTCESVEKNAKLALEALYADKVKSGAYTFTAINLDDESSKPLAKKLEVGGQTLLVVNGKSKADITSEGFMCATNLDKMKAEVQKAVVKVSKK